MQVLVCGDRNWNNIEAVGRELKKLPQDTIIIHGAARGADSLGDHWGHKLGMKVKSYPAQWKTYGKSAGPIRNQQMLNENPNIDLVLAFHSNIENSKGTKDMINRARQAGIEVRLIME